MILVITNDVRTTSKAGRKKCLPLQKTKVILWTGVSVMPGQWVLCSLPVALFSVSRYQVSTRSQISDSQRNNPNIICVL